MAGTRAAIRYAKAILDLANSKGVAEAVDTDMKSIADN
jgi:F-type H+-transporting ATPase subunit delta